MKISSLISQKFIGKNFGQKRNIQQNQTGINKLERSPIKDSVSFKSSLNMGEILQNQNSKNAFEFAGDLIKEIYSNGNIDLKIIEKVISKKYPEVQVKPMSELTKINPNASAYKAYVLNDIDNNFNRINMQMYLNLPKTVQELPDFISDAAHEYTHLSQYFTSNTDINFLREHSGNNREVSETLRAIYESTFNTFDTNIPTYLPIIEKHDANEAKNIIDSHSRGIIQQLLSQLSKEDNPKHLNDLLSVYSESEKLVKDTKKYCSIKANSEKEAYATEFALAKEINPPMINAYARFVNFFSKIGENFNE